MRHYFLITKKEGHKVLFYDENGYRISFTDQDPANSDYQAYLAWVAEGNTAEEWSQDDAS